MKKLVCALFVGSCLFAHAETKPYVSIYAGGSGLQETDFVMSNAGGNYPGKLQYDVTPVYGIAIGTSISEWPIRVEFEYSYRKSDFKQAGFSGLAPEKNPDGNMSAETFMGNLYYDFINVDSPVIPYVFVGAGVLCSELTLPVNWGVKSSTDTVFAGQAGLGASWALTDHIVLDVKGRVIVSDKTEYKDSNMDGDNLIYAEVLAGIRLQF